MKRILVILIIAITTQNFISCEEEASAVDFLSDEDKEGLLGVEIPDDDELGILDPPLFIAEIDGEAFVAEYQLGELSGGTLEIKFITEEGRELVLSIPNPGIGTYTAGANSLDPFRAQYTIGDDTIIYSTTSEEEINQASGVLIITDYTGASISGTFDFTAYNVDGTDDSVAVTIGRFNDAQIIN